MEPLATLVFAGLSPVYTMGVALQGLLFLQSAAIR